MDEWERASRVTLKILLVCAAVSWFTIGCLLIGEASADHDGGDQAWRQPILAECEPPWDPGDPAIVARDGQTLHDQPDDVRARFYATWGDADLHGGQHPRRWRWEHDCQHPPADPPDAGLRRSAAREAAPPAAPGSRGSSPPAAEAQPPPAEEAAEAMIGDCPPVNPSGEATQHIPDLGNTGWHCHWDRELPDGATPARPDFRYGRVYHQHGDAHDGHGHRS